MAKGNGSDSTKVKKVAIIEVKPLSQKTNPDDTEFKKARVAKENARHAQEFMGHGNTAHLGIIT